MTDENTPRIGEPQYEAVIAEMRQRGPERLGLMTSWAWHDDPKRLAFTIARYKFVSKMVAGASKVLEVGCGDGFGARVVAQSVTDLTCLDFDPEFIESAKSVANERYGIKFFQHDMLAGPFSGSFDGVYSLDVLEHIPETDEDLFLTNMIEPLSESGVCVIGMPSLESQVYASEFSRLGHVNCKNQSLFRDVMKKYFSNVFMFSMNDEVVHTGYEKMSHYNIALCCGKKSVGK